MFRLLANHTNRPSRPMRGLLLAFSLLTFLLAAAHAQQPLIEKFVLNDTIQPVSAGQLDRALALANTDGAAALLIQVNTPGGLVESMRGMAGAILSSKVPVIIYVAPAGARAASAGFFLLEAADIAAMAPGTNAGAAHVVYEFGKPDQTLEQKIENDAEAFLRSYVGRRNRNIDAAIAAVQSSHSYSAEEALNQHLIDLTASSESELLQKLDGREITRLDGSKQTLHLANARIQTFKSSMREDLLDWLVNPNIALLLLVGGGLLIYLEFNTPGTIVPGALGTLMVLLAIFALNLLPIRYTAVMLLLAAAVLLVLEAKFGGHGALAIAGIVCLTLGTLTLIAAPIPELAVNPWVAIAISAGFGGITVLLVRIAMRARHLKQRLGFDALVGKAASAMEPLTPQGHVLVDGEIWQATADQEVPAGTPLRVIGHKDFLLEVTPTRSGPAA
ncbi:NfeD family protein [Occallatibacter riparius]|uniref:Nodulation protein NfeD n=1 Tax=Occallatibacter riparius TaxID=1002689 RepID=A0A9J7BMY2_9BACT|nr:nodulation protein NfeD [Occallatibacter riparius]UWZ84244.1 nodulation protein NfeD [Occallatibacter riparius]